VDGNKRKDRQTGREAGTEDKNKQGVTNMQITGKSDNNDSHRRDFAL